MITAQGLDQVAGDKTHGGATPAQTDHGRIAVADAVGVFELFRVGIGPSSSHTVGPMLAAKEFAERLESGGELPSVARLDVDLYGSLAATGKGHGTLEAVLMGLEGNDPERIDLDRRATRLRQIEHDGIVLLAGIRPITLRLGDIALHPLTRLPGHPNGMRFRAVDECEHEVLAAEISSIGGGFIRWEGEETAETGHDQVFVPYPFTSAAELLKHCRVSGRSVSEVMRANERARRSDTEIATGIAHLADTMVSCIADGVRHRGVLPGGLGVRRRAGEWYDQLMREDNPYDPVLASEWLSVAAMAVNEENAAGGRIVTAPTNGAAGIVPSVLSFAMQFAPPFQHADEQGRVELIERFFLAAAAVGSVIKARASISGAEVGCQGEVGSACSMAAAGYTEILGGTPEQVENAAEIAMEHHLGLTCDPVGGLVQIPCIERNGMAANTAIVASRVALRGDGTHHVPLDTVIETMRQTGLDMSSKYKETSMGGLAVNVVEC